jgi:hypothetical protein
MFEEEKQQEKEGHEISKFRTPSFSADAIKFKRMGQLKADREQILTGTRLIINADGSSLKVKKYDSDKIDVVATIPELFGMEEKKEEQPQYEIITTKKKEVQPAYVVVTLDGNFYDENLGYRGIIVSDKWYEPYDYISEEDAEISYNYSTQQYSNHEISMDYTKHYSGSFTEQEISLFPIGGTEIRTIKKEFKNIPRINVQMFWDMTESDLTHRVVEVYNYYLSQIYWYLLPTIPQYYRNESDPSEWDVSVLPDEECIPETTDLEGGWILLSDEYREWRYSFSDLIYSDSDRTVLVKSVDSYFNMNYRVRAEMARGTDAYQIMSLWGGVNSIEFAFGNTWIYDLARESNWVLYADTDTINIRGTDDIPIYQDQPPWGFFIYDRGGQYGTVWEGAPIYEEWLQPEVFDILLNEGGSLDEDRTVYCGLIQEYHDSYGYWDDNWKFYDCPIRWYITCPPLGEYEVYIGGDEAVFPMTVTCYNRNRVRDDWVDLEVDPIYLWGMVINDYEGGEPQAKQDGSGAYDTEIRHSYGMWYDEELYTRIFQNSFYSELPTEYWWTIDANYHYIEGTEDVIPIGCVFSGSCVMVEVEITQEIARRIS